MEKLLTKIGGVFSNKNDVLKNNIYDIFIIKINNKFYPNPKLFKFLKDADNLHDFNKLTKDFTGIQLDIENNDTLFITCKEDFEKKLFNTIYILIRLWGKLSLDKLKYEKLKDYINYSISNISNECIIDNGAKMITNNNLFLFLGKKDRIKNIKIIKDKIDDGFYESINGISCKEVNSLPKLLDRQNISNTEKLNDFELPYYLLFFDINGKIDYTAKYTKTKDNMPKIIIKKDEKVYLEIIKTNKKTGWYFNIEKYDSILKLMYSNSEIKNNELFEEIKNYIKKNNNLGIIYTNIGLTQNKNKLFGINDIDNFFDNDADIIKLTDEINYLLKNLGDVGLAFYASVNNLHFKTTDNIAKTYFIIFNFYKFLNRNNFNFEYLPFGKEDNGKIGKLLL